MIEVSFTEKGFRISGHSGYDEAGKDIVCAAVSSCANMLLYGAEEVLKIKCDVKADGSLPLLSFEAPKSLSEGQKSGLLLLLNAFKLQLKSVEEEYPDYLKVF